VILCSAILLCLAVGFVAGRAIAGPARPPHARVYLVKAGDTLWSIASRFAGPRKDPRPLVDLLVEQNDIVDARIASGDRLVLPSP
jgi:Tfp pilus assembly protein FimV